MRTRYSRLIPLFASVACSNHAPAGPDASLGPVHASESTERGRIEILVSVSGRAEATVLNAGEGGTIIPVIAGEPTYERTSGRLRLPVALENRGRHRLRPPIYLYGWTDSLVVTRPVGFQRPVGRDRPPVVTANSDSTRSDLAGAWVFDDLLFHDSSRTLAAGQRSGVRWIELTLHAGIQRFRWVLHASARHAAPPVPANPPNGLLIPQEQFNALYEPRNQVFDHPRGSGGYPRNLLVVRFSESATPDQRQAAVDLVAGEVIGGNGVYYYVLIPARDDGSTLWRAVDLIASRPGVEDVGPELMLMRVGPTFERPSDGYGWGRTDWELNPDSAAGPNWAAESINAPAAWGCSVGDSSVAVAVVDVEAAHMTAVSSVITRPANDSVGIAGLMWRGRFYLSDASSNAPPGVAVGQQLLRDMEAAVARKPHVVNFSLAILYYDTLPGGTLQRRLPRPGPTDSLTAERFGRYTASLLRHWEERYGAQPLYVLGAGNYQTDALYTGYPVLGKDSVLRSRVLVVAAHDSAWAGPRSRQLWANSGHPEHPGSSFGPLVDIAAPGKNVTAEVNGQLMRVQGTSYAAPHAAGVAGLLMSFDPRLTAADLKALVVRGAMAGGRTAGGFPLLNGYKSLQLAAERTGAPLCGTRVWADGGFIRAARGGGDVETLIPAGATIEELEVLHGGRVIRYYDPGPGETRVYRWKPGQWEPGTLTRSEGSSEAPAYRSFLGASHDRDSIATAEYIASGLRLSLIQVSPFRRVQLAIIPGAAATQSISQACILTGPGGGCGKFATVGTTVTRSSGGVTYSPRGDRVLALVNEQTSATSIVGEWYRCPQPRGGVDSSECRDLRTDVVASRGTVYSVSVRTGHFAPIVAASVRFAQPSMADGDRDEFVVTARNSSSTSLTTWIRQADGGLVMQTTEGTGDYSCAVQFRSASTGDLLLSQQGCGWADATFSPGRAPG